MPIKIGSLDFKALKLGSISIIKGYLGNTEIWSEQVPAIDMSLFDENGNARSTGRSTANTYYVKTAGYYMFPVVYGNAIKFGSTNSAAYTSNGGQYSHNFVNHLDNQITDPWIENNSGCVPVGAELSLADTNNIFSDIKLVTGSDTHKYIRFKVNSVPATNANGIISVLDSNNTVMWSWFICCRQEGIETAEFTNYAGRVRVMSTHNIGDLWDEASHIHSKHWFYEWGRHTPLICGAAYDSTDNHVSYGVKQYTTSATVAATRGYAIQHPEMWFPRNDTTNSNWYNEGERWIGVNLWDASSTTRNTTPSETNPVKTIYDPSPVGYVVPSGAAFTGFTSTGGDTSSTSDFRVVGQFNNGWNFKRNLADGTGNKFWCGDRNRGGTGIIEKPTTEMWYWTSQMYNVGNGMTLFASSTRVHPRHSRGVAYSTPIRFQKDGTQTWDNFTSLSELNRTFASNTFTFSEPPYINQLRIKDTGDPAGSTYPNIYIKGSSLGDITINTYAKTIKIGSTTYNWSNAAIQSKHEGGYYYFNFNDTAIWGTGAKYVHSYQAQSQAQYPRRYAMENAYVFGMQYI